MEQERVVVEAHRPEYCYRCGARLEGDAYRTVRWYRMKHLQYQKYFCNEKCAREYLTRDKAWQLDRRFSYTDKQWSKVMSTQLEPVFIVRYKVN